jgi:hypothetical protein
MRNVILTTAIVNQAQTTLASTGGKATKQYIKKTEISEVSR